MSTCQCGCGQQTRIAPVNDRSKGWVKGIPLRFINGHNTKALALARSIEAIGSKGTSSHGYTTVRVAQGERRYEHVMAAEEALGRKLRSFGAGHPNTEVVHHIDGNKRNNTKGNLLVCTHQYHVELHARLESSPAWPQFSKRIHHPIGCRRVGKSGFKGVYFDKRKSRFEAHIRHDGRTVHLGAFKKAEDAAMAYDSAAHQLKGDSWITNRSLGLLP